MRGSERGSEMCGVGGEGAGGVGERRDGGWAGWVGEGAGGVGRVGMELEGTAGTAVG